MYYSEQKMLRQMQERIDCLEKENRYLKDLLDRAGISYEQTPNENQTQEDTFDPNQGARIQNVEITDELANRFFSRFWGRQDVYSKRYVKKGTGEAGVLSDVWVTSSFSFCFTEPIWRLVANPGNMRIPKVQKEPKPGIIRSAIISGQKNVPARWERRLSVGTAAAKAGRNWISPC